MAVILKRLLLAPLTILSAFQLCQIVSEQPRSQGLLRLQYGGCKMLRDIAAFLMENWIHFFIHNA